MNEIWKDIPGYEGLYQVSSEGRVKSLERVVTDRRSTRKVPGRILRPYLEYDGYLVVNLSQKNKVRAFKVHRLVLLAFIGPSDLECNHKNEVKIDNRLENLEWVSHHDNIRYSWDLNDEKYRQRNCKVRTGKKFSATARKKMSEAHQAYLRRKRNER